MAKTIESNLIVRSKLPAPEGEGLKSMEASLTKIDALMNSINSRKLTIVVEMAGGAEALTTLNGINAAANAARRAPPVTPPAGPANPTLPGGPQGPRGPRGGGAGGGGGQPPRPRVGTPTFQPIGNLLETRERITQNEEGDGTLRNQRTFVHDQGNIQRTQVLTDTGDTTSEEITTRNLAVERERQRNKQEAARQQRLQEREANARRVLAQRQQLGVSTGNTNIAEGFSVRKSTPRDVALLSDQPLTRATATMTEYVRVEKDGTETIRKYDEATGRQTEKVNLNTEAVKKNNRAAAEAQKLADRNAQIAANTARGNAVAGRLGRNGFTEAADSTRQKSGDPLTAVRTFTRELADGSQEIFKYNTASGELFKTTNKNTQAHRDFTRQAALAKNTIKANSDILDLQSNGFVKHSESIKNFTIGNKAATSSLTELHRVTGSALTGNLQVEIAKVDSSTGKMTTQVIQGSQAIRAMGDSFANSVAKVGLWFLATSSIFLAARGVQFASQKFQELEANTVFLARVGGNLGANFRERLVEAKLLTNGIVELSSALGTDAAEGQRAASIFLRAGQTRVEALRSTEAALVASKIAELGVEESAKLLQAAQAQFNLSSQQLLPTLDTLNTLSNNYRVSTDDLLQSISRSGSVYADAGGSLAELAAATAISAKTTARSGAEIGNAFKTIISRLTTPELSGTLVEKLGITMRDASGDSKSFVKILLQLQSALQNVSATERDRILVQIGGARQVNILKSALNDVTGIVLAEAQALRDNGSALSEARDNADTLAATIGRLKAQFEALVNASGPAIGTIGTALVNTLNLLLRLFGVFDGMIIKVGIFIIAFTLLRAVVVRVGDSALYAALRVSVLGSAVATTGAQATTASAGMGLLQLALTRANVIALALTVGIAALAYGLSYLTSQSDLDAVATQKRIDDMQKATSAAEKNHEATLALASALREEYAAQKRLNEERARRKPGADNSDLDKRQAASDERLARLHKAFGGNKEEDISGKVASSREELKAKLQGELADSKKTESDLDVSIKRQEAKLNERVEFLAKYQADLNKPGREFVLGSKEFIAERTEAIDKLKAELKDFKAKSDESITRSKELALRLDKVSSQKEPTALTDDVLKAISSGNSGAKRLDAFKRFRDAQGKLGRLSGSETAEDEKSLSDLTKGVHELQTGLEGLNDDSSLKIFEKFRKEILETAEQARNLSFDIAIRKIKDFTEYFSFRRSSASGVAQKLKVQDAILAFAQDNIPGKKGLGGEKFEEFETNQAQIKAARAAAADSAVALNAVPGRGGPKEQRLALTAALQKDIQDNLNAAKEGELKSVDQILKIEQDITKEKLKQNIETAKSLGLLSDEEKINVLRSAKFFRDNPGKKVSLLDQFLGSSDSNATNQKFFGKHLDRGLNPDQKFDKFLLDAGIGPDNEDLDAAQKRLKKFQAAENGGIPGFAAGAVDRAQQDDFNARKFHGKAVPPGAFGPFLPDQLKLDIGVNAETFRPLIQSFEGAVTKQLSVLQDELIKEINALWDQVNAIPAVNRQIPGVEL